MKKMVVISGSYEFNVEELSGKLVSPSTGNNFEVANFFNYL